MNARKGMRAFTLLELMIVVVILAILAATASVRYGKIVLKSKVAKARHAISLIGEAEKIFEVENDGYQDTATGSIDTDIGSGATGINLSELDNDSIFQYRVSGGVISAEPQSGVKVGSCTAGDKITYDLNSGSWTMDSCYQ